VDNLMPIEFELPEDYDEEDFDDDPPWDDDDED
jgi:hypothetical protein